MPIHQVDLHSTAIRDFCRKWKIKELSVFGSVIRDDFGPGSDIDFMVDYEDEADWDLLDHFHMQDELALIVGREVDILDREGLESSENRFLKKEIFSTAERVYATR